MRNKFLKKLKTSFHFQISRRDLTISDVAFAQQNENKLSFAFAYSQHCTRKKGVKMGEEEPRRQRSKLLILNS